MRIRTRYAVVAAGVACCCLLVTGCGTQHAGAGAAATPAAGSSVADGTSDDGREELPDTTTDDGAQELPDTTTDDQELPDTTTDDGAQELPDTTSDDSEDALPDTTTDDGQGGLADTTDDGAVPTSGPHRWFPMLRDFRAYLTTDAAHADAAIARHVTSADVRMPAGSGRGEAVVRVDYGAGEEAAAERTAAVFAEWRHSVYGDHGHVTVLGPAKTTAERDW